MKAHQPSATARTQRSHTVQNSPARGRVGADRIGSRNGSELSATRLAVQPVAEHVLGPGVGTDGAGEREREDPDFAFSGEAA